MSSTQNNKQDLGASVPRDVAAAPSNREPAAQFVTFVNGPFHGMKRPAADQQAWALDHPVLSRGTYSYQRSGQWAFYTGFRRHAA